MFINENTPIKCTLGTIVMIVGILNFIFYIEIANTHVKLNRFFYKLVGESVEHALQVTYFMCRVLGIICIIVGIAMIVSAFT